MLPGFELMGCTDLAVPGEVMHHVAKVESSLNPYAIGVVGGRLARQPKSLDEAVATAKMLEAKGYNFSLGIAQVNRYNLAKYGLGDYATAFGTCRNLQAGSRILAECHDRSGGDWGKSFSCYYSGNFVTGYRHGYVAKVFASMNGAAVPHARVGTVGSSERERRLQARTSRVVETLDAVGTAGRLAAANAIPAQFPPQANVVAAASAMPGVPPVLARAVVEPAALPHPLSQPVNAAPPDAGAASPDSAFVF